MNELLLKNARIIDPARNIDKVGDIAVANGVIVDAAELKAPEVIDLTGKVLSPGFIDVHVHLRQPGNTTAETIATGSMAAAAGGFINSHAHGMGDAVPVHDNPTVRIARRTADRLYQRGFGTEKPVLVRIENGNKRHLG